MHALLVTRDDQVITEFQNEFSEFIQELSGIRIDNQSGVNLAKHLFSNEIFVA